MAVVDQCYPEIVVGGTILHWHKLTAPLCNPRCYVTATPGEPQPPPG